MSQNVEITILGQKYVVRSDQEESQLKEVARYVDARLGELTKGGRATTLSVAIIGALNIANEYFMYRRQVEEKLKLLDERAERLMGLLEEQEKRLNGDP